MYVWYYRTYINNIHFTIVDLYLFLSHILGDPKQNRYIIYINIIPAYIYLQLLMMSA